MQLKNDIKLISQRDSFIESEEFESLISEIWEDKALMVSSIINYNSSEENEYLFNESSITESEKEIAKELYLSFLRKKWWVSWIELVEEIESRKEILESESKKPKDAIYYLKDFSDIEKLNIWLSILEVLWLDEKAKSIIVSFLEDEVRLNKLASWSDSIRIEKFFRVIDLLEESDINQKIKNNMAKVLSNYAVTNHGYLVKGNIKKIIIKLGIAEEIYNLLKERIENCNFEGIENIAESTIGLIKASEWKINGIEDIDDTFERYIASSDDVKNLYLSYYSNKEILTDKDIDRINYIIESEKELIYGEVLWVIKKHWNILSDANIEKLIKETETLYKRGYILSIFNILWFFDTGGDLIKLLWDEDNIPFFLLSRIKKSQGTIEKKKRLFEAALERWEKEIDLLLYVKNNKLEWESIFKNWALNEIRNENFYHFWVLFNLDLDSDFIETIFDSIDKVKLYERMIISVFSEKDAVVGSSVHDKIAERYFANKERRYSYHKNFFFSIFDENKEIDWLRYLPYIEHYPKLNERFHETMLHIWNFDYIDKLNTDNLNIRLNRASLPWIINILFRSYNKIWNNQYQAKEIKNFFLRLKDSERISDWTKRDINSFAQRAYYTYESRLSDEGDILIERLNALDNLVSNTVFQDDNKENLENEFRNSVKDFPIEVIIFMKDNHKFWDSDVWFLNFATKKFYNKWYWTFFILPEIYNELKEYYISWNFDALSKIAEIWRNNIWDLKKLVKLKKYFWREIIDDLYLRNWERDLHNWVEMVDQIISLCEEMVSKWKMSKDQFINVVLKRSWDRTRWFLDLNIFLTAYESDWLEVLKSEVETQASWENTPLTDLWEEVIRMDETGELYSDIDKFFKIKDIISILNQKDALRKLSVLLESNDPKDKLKYNFYSEAIFHPRSNSKLMMEMFSNPEKFLWLNDGNAPERVHKVKKPANMVTSFEYMNFTPEDLTDSLVLWEYDEVSYFKPANMIFYADNKWNVYEESELYQALVKIIINSKKLFPQVLTYLREEKWYSEAKYITYKDNKSGILSLLIEVWFEEIISYFREKEELRDLINLSRFYAEIAPKTDPSVFFNWFNCDKLSEHNWKKVVALFNPMCIDFSIYKWEKSEKDDNLKITSWLTLNRRIWKKFSDIYKKLEGWEENIVSLLGESFHQYKDSDEYYLTADNIEAHPNFENSFSQGSVWKMYQKFFSKYISDNPSTPWGIKVNHKVLLCWDDNAKFSPFDAKVDNNFLPIYVNSYTDNTGEKTSFAQLEAESDFETVNKKKWIHPLMIEDVVSLSYLEDNIHPEWFKNHIWNLQHEITASILNNRMKWYDDYSMVYYNENWELVWYMLAYKWEWANEESCIYVSDIWVLKKERWRAGLEMMKEFLDRYTNNGEDCPIVAVARTDTSYAIIEKMWAKKWLIIAYDDWETSMWWSYSSHEIVMVRKGEYDENIEYDEYIC